MDCYKAYINITNDSDIEEVKQGDSNKSFFDDPKILKNSKERIRILKEELFFEDVKKE